MKKIYKLFAGSLLAAGMLASSVASDAALQYKQVGTPNGSSTAKTSNLPVYCMSKFGEGISIYKKDALGIPSGSVIKEISYLGYYTPSSSKDFTGATMEVYVANATATSKYTDFIIAGENEGGKPTTVLDKSKCTLFYSGAYTLTEGGSQTEPIEFMKVVSTTDGFNYTGEGIMIFISIYTPKFGGSFANAVLCQASGNTYSPNGAYREASYATEGYGINTHSWYEYNTASKPMPVMKIGYEGERQKITANISGKVLSSLNNSGLSGASVSLAADGTTLATVSPTPTSGQFSFTVDDVDVSAVYTLVASKDGYEAQTKTIDIKAGGNFSNQDITLTKLPVPATLSGKVVDKNTNQPIVGAMVTFDNNVYTTKEGGDYTFNIANIDVLPADGLELKASVTGYNGYSTKLSITGDMTFNIEMVPLPALPGEGAQIGEYNTVDYNYVAPFNPLWNISVSETIYPKGLLSNLKKDTKYSSVSFYGYLNPVSSGTGGGDDNGDNGDGDDYNDYWTAPAKADAEPQPWKGHVKIYMVNTTASRYNSINDATDYSSMTPLFDGDVTINEGGKNNDPALLFTADLTEAFEYAGDNIKLICVAESKTSRLVYFAYDPTYSSNILGKAQSNQDAFNSAAMQLYDAGVPVIKLGDYVPTATVYGTVTDKKTNAAVEGATVTLAKGTDKVSATTDSEGKYSLSWRGIAFGDAYTLNVEKTPYDEVTTDVSFTEATLNMQYNAQLTVSGTVSGKVTDKVTGDALADMTVKVYTADNTEVTIDASEAKTADDGTYMITIPEVDFASYFVEISGGKYTAEKKEISFSPEKVANEDVNFEMTFDATVSGKVTFSDGPAVAGAIVKIGELTATTDEEGNYSIPVAPVTAASATVTVTYSNEEVYTGTVELTTGAEITFNITLQLSGVNMILGADGKADVYGINGVVIARDADASAVKSLPAGIYIINGKKMVIAK